MSSEVSRVSLVIKSKQVMKTNITTGTKVMYTDPCDLEHTFAKVLSVKKKVATVITQHNEVEEISIDYLINIDEEFQKIERITIS